MNQRYQDEMHASSKCIISLVLFSYFALHVPLALAVEKTLQRKPIAVKAYADIVIKTVRLDAGCHIITTVANNGPGSLSNDIWTARTSARLMINVNGSPFGAAPIWGFDPNKLLQTPGGVVDYTTPFAVTGSVTVQAIIDDENQITEANENNNDLSVKLTCAKRIIKAGRFKSQPTPDAEPSDQPQAATLPTYVGPSPTQKEKSVELTPSMTEPTQTTIAATTPATPTASGSGGNIPQSTLPPPPSDLPPHPPKQDKSVEPGELVVVSADMTEAQAVAQQAQSMGLAVKRRTTLTGLGFVVTVLRVPKEMAVGDVLTSLRQAMPSVWVDANHRYELFGDDTVSYARKLIGFEKVSALCGDGMRVGLVDTALETMHPTLQNRTIVSNSFLPTGVKLAKSDHGTAIGALLIGNTQPSGFSGMLPAAKLYAATVFRDNGEGVDTTAEWIVQSLDWLLQQHVHVINLSFGGPRNLLLEAAMNRLVASGVIVVAAAGNQGADAPAVYPAAQPGVIAVTAVDADVKAWPKANHGNYIMFAAPGVDVWSAQVGGEGVYLSGTSYAVPFVVAAFTAARQKNQKRPWTEIQHDLQTSARDLGEQGKDSVFGWGLLQSKGCGKK